MELIKLQQGLADAIVGRSYSIETNMHQCTVIEYARKQPHLFTIFGVFLKRTSSLFLSNFSINLHTLPSMTLSGYYDTQTQLGYWGSYLVKKGPMLLYKDFFSMREFLHICDVMKSDEGNGSSTAAYHGDCIGRGPSAGLGAWTRPASLSLIFLDTLPTRKPPTSHDDSSSTPVSYAVLMSTISTMI